MSKFSAWQEKEFNEFLAAKQSGLVEFGAPWCSACKMVEPILEAIATENEGVLISRVDVSQNPGLASRMGVMSLPNILVIAKGKVVDQLIGATSKKAILDKISKLN